MSKKPDLLKYLHVKIYDFDNDSLEGEIKGSKAENKIYVGIMGEHLF